MDPTDDNYLLGEAWWRNNVFNQMTSMPLLCLVLCTVETVLRYS